jgi:hypothetical protein
MEVNIYHADLPDVPWLMEQAKEFSKFSQYKKKQLYPGDEFAKGFFENLIEKQVVFMAKALKEGFIYNDESGACKLTEIEEIEDKPPLMKLTTEFDEDPWIRTGFIAGFLYPHFFNPDIVTLSELFWWVPEEYRGTRSGLLLFKYFKEFGEERADQVIMTLEEETPVKPEFLTKKGFRVKEHSYLLEV